MHELESSKTWLLFFLTQSMLTESSFRKVFLVCNLNPFGFSFFLVFFFFGKVNTLLLVVSSTINFGITCQLCKWLETVTTQYMFEGLKLQKKLICKVLFLQTSVFKSATAGWWNWTNNLLPPWTLELLKKIHTSLLIIQFKADTTKFAWNLHLIIRTVPIELIKIFGA